MEGLEGLKRLEELTRLEGLNLKSLIVNLKS